MTEHFVETSSLTLYYDQNLPPVLDHLSFTLPKGKMVGLVGPDGAGKTTLIRVLSALLTKYSGSVKIEGYDPFQDQNKIHQIIGYMPQNFGLYEDLSVIQNLSLYADLKNLHGNKRTQRINKLLSFSSLKPFVNRLAGKLSGGMKQKLGLSCALLGEPKYLILDEPTVGVDPISRRELWEMVQILLKDGLSILWSTSYLDEAEKCDLVLLLSEGKLLFQGSPAHFIDPLKKRVFQINNLSQPHKTFRKLIAHPHILDVVLQGSSLRVVFDDTHQKLKDLVIEKHVKMVPVKPQFEDAFIARLGGIPKKGSSLIDQMQQVDKNDKFVIEAVTLTKKFGDFTAVNQISFQVKRGEIFGLLGPNGAGKSTTFKMLCGLIRPTSGKALVSGLSLQEAPSQARGKIGYMAQKFSLYGMLSVFQNLQFFSQVYAVPRDLRKNIVLSIAAIFELDPYLELQAGEIPLGFQKRLSLACSLMHKPEVLFLDEPTSGVDPITRREFWQHIHALVEKGVTVMVTTHFMEEAEFCDRIGLIHKGKLFTIDTPQALKEKAISKKTPEPTLEDAFIMLCQQSETKNHE